MIIKKNSQDKKHCSGFIIKIAITEAMVIVTYGVSILIGGAFYEFCSGAVIWVLFGVAVAGYFAHF